MGRQAVTLRDVAREAKTSLQSVSNYLHDYPHIRPELRERIAAAIETLGYTPNVAARNLRMGKTGQLLLSVPDIRQNYFAQMAADIIDEAKAFGYNVIIRSCDGGRDDELSGLDIASQRTVDGVIVASIALEAEDINARRRNFPLAAIGASLDGVDAPYYKIDNVRGAYLATTHLLDAGCRRVALIGAPPAEDNGRSAVSLRFQGYRQALEERGLEVDERLLRDAHRLRAIYGAEAIGAMLDSGVKFDAVFATNDTTAWGVIAALHARGIRVPADVRVVGFDDLTESRYLVPPLTSVNPQLNQICHMAVESVVEQIQSGRCAQAETIVPQASLTYRESSPAMGQMA